MTITIDLCNKNTGKYFGLCLIEPKSPMTHLVLMELADLLRTRLHAVLTQKDQEGEMTPVESFRSQRSEYEFREMAYPAVRTCVEEIAELFGEDATVSVDLNLDYHGQRSMIHLYEAELDVAVGVMREEGWHKVVLGEGWQEQMLEWMS